MMPHSRLPFRSEDSHSFTPNNTWTNTWTSAVIDKEPHNCDNSQVRAANIIILRKDGLDTGVRLRFAHAGRACGERLPPLISREYCPSYHGIFSSTTANNPFTNETFSRKDNGRLSSSDTRTSSSPDDGLHAYEQTSSRQGRSNGLRHSNHQRSLLPLDKSSNSADLADDSLTSVKLTGRNRKHTPRIHKQPSLRPIHSNSEPQRGQGNATHITNTNPLSISGVNKPEITTANCDQDNGASEDRLGAGWTHAQNNARIPTVTKPPVLTSHPSPSEKAASSSGQTNLRKHYRTNSNNNNNNSTSPSANSKVISNTPSKTSSRTKDDPMYSDPIAGAPVSFQARLSELAALESETIRYERLRKVKRKTKERDD